jgi:hypothetical protein
MNQYAELEWTIRRQESDRYSLEYRFVLPDSEVEVRSPESQVLSVRFDFPDLLGLVDDAQAYGRALSQQLFAEPTVHSAFNQAYTSAQARQLALRLRLSFYGPSDELHGLHWESLVNLDTGAPLFTGENLLFSRFLSSADWQPVHLRPKGDLNALIAIANPANLADYNLAAIDGTAELNRARLGLGSIPSFDLHETSPGAHTTLDTLSACLRDREFDILYLVCHGAVIKDEPWLWLEDDQGKVARVSGKELALRLAEQTRRPRLVILASCQSAGKGSGSALAALGPRLAEAGVPAVIAMQGNISSATLSEFMPVFFTELQRDGQIDRAIAVARGAVRQRTDFWMPVLFMRLKSGRLWYVPGFGGGGSDFEKWDSLKSAVLEAQCTPILGPGLIEPLIGSQHELAQRWAARQNYPLFPDDQDVLPRVAQYMLVRHNPVYLRQALNQSIREEILRRYASQLPETLVKAQVWTPDKIINALEVVADQTGAGSPALSYQQLASLRLPIYITANPGDMLSRALIDAGVDPQIRLCAWNNDIPKSKCTYLDLPTPEKPLVFHLFGHLNDPASLVLTEDDYLDYLIGVTNNRDLIPPAVREALVNTSLLFLGFQIDDWNFRVFFRTLMAQAGRQQRVFYSHVAAQIEPDENRLLNPERARQFFERYFEGGRISIYWGSPAEFLTSLVAQLKVA